MISFEEAYKLVLKYSIPLNIVKTNLVNAIGMTLAEDIFSDVDIPPFDKSSMDGYAVRSADINALPAVLEVIGEVKAGESFKGTLNKSQAIRIMTGAPLPQGADAVVMVEETEEILNGRVKINVKPGLNDNIVKMARDITKGASVLERGQTIRSAEIAVLATVGREDVKVYRRPMVSVITTGDELICVGEVPSGSRIRNCNGPLLISMLNEDGYEVRDLGIISDDRDALKEAVYTGLEGDLLLISGGVSAGKYDIVPAILKEVGVKEIFHKVNMRPGKPLYFGNIEKKLIFGMPGNPISTFLTYRIFVKGALDKTMGKEDIEFKTLSGILTESISKTDKRKTFIPADAFYKNGIWYLRPIEYGDSANVLALSKSNAFAILNEDVERIDAGNSVEFFRW